MEEERGRREVRREGDGLTVVSRSFLIFRLVYYSDPGDKGRSRSRLERKVYGVGLGGRRESDRCCEGQPISPFLETVELTSIPFFHSLGWVLGQAISYFVREQTKSKEFMPQIAIPTTLSAAEFTMNAGESCFRLFSIDSVD